MSPFSRLQSHPLRFLLYLEWVLLVSVAASELIGLSFYTLPRIPLLNWLCLLALAGAGWSLPIYRRQPRDTPIASLAQIMGNSNSQASSLLDPRTSFLAGWELGLIVLAATLGGMRLFFLLFIVSVVRNCLRFHQRGRVLFTGIAFLLCLASFGYRLQWIEAPVFVPVRDIPGWFLVSMVVLLGLVMVVLLLLVNAVLSEYESRQQLAIANAQLRDYALRIEDIATLQERNRIARDIHDSLGHTLIVLNLNLEAALKLRQSQPTEATEFLRASKQLGSTLLDQVRQSVHALRSDPLEGKSLEAAIVQLLDEFHRSTGITPIRHLEPTHSLPNDVATVLYRITQEALTNICKYADADRVELYLYTNPEVCLTIQDNGCGFCLEQTTTGFGLQGMRERTLALGGKLTIETSPGAGCRIVVTVD